MPPFAGVFNVLHDAIVVAISGEVPGTVVLELDCDQLRERFEGPGARFFLTIKGCARIVYHPAETKAAMRDLAAIAARRLWIRAADQHDGHCIVHCSEHAPGGSSGKLEIAADGLAVTIDNGREVSFGELEEAAEEYWSGIRARHSPD
jgi:hypothetical protein